MLYYLCLSFAKGVNMKSKLIADSIADHLTLAEHRIHTCKCGTAVLRDVWPQYQASAIPSVIGSDSGVERAG